MAKQELFEAIPFELIEAREIEHNGERLMQVKGIMHRANELNGNHRIYPAAILSREVNKLKERLGSGDTMFSQADDPAGGVSRISDTAAMPTSVESTPKHEVIGTAVILPTQKGKDLAAIVRAGGTVSILVRGFGTTRPGECAGQQGEVVQEDYQLVTYDFVIGQSLGQHQIPEPGAASTGRRLTVKQQKFADFLTGPANGNGVLAARWSGYRGNDRQLAVQASVNRRHPVIRKIISEKLAALAEPSLTRMEEGLDATIRRAFLTKTGNVVYGDPEPYYQVRVKTATKLLELLERSSHWQDSGSQADQVVHPQQDDQNSEERREQVASLAPTDRNLIRRTSEIDEKLAEIDHQLAEDDDGTEGQGQN